MVGFNKSYSPTITVANTDQSVSDLLLKPASTELSEVKVVATKPLIEQKIDKTVLNVENSILAAGNSALEILTKAPGVTVDKDDNISLRGKQGVLVMIDGKPTYLSQAELANLLRATEGNAIQSIEIITNPSAKYDAAGNSGIINIKLKKNKANGTNGSITAGAGYGSYYKSNAGLTLNHRQVKINVFGSYNYGNNKYFNDLWIKRSTGTETPTFFDQVNNSRSVFKNNNFKGGVDYFINDKHTLGVMVSGYSNGNNEFNFNNTRLGSRPHEVDSSLLVLGHNDNSYRSIAYNLNYKATLDTLGKEFTADFDYSKFSSRQDFNYDNYFYQANGTPSKPAAFFQNHAPTTLHIKSGKIDYVHPFNKTMKMETGVKSSWVTTDNNFQFDVKQQNDWVTDPVRSNNFVYDENINAAYVNLSKEFKKTHVQVGLRAEQTNSKGNLITTREVLKRHYLDFFPSVFVKQTLSKNNDIGFSYSRRIDRPSYYDLNPFVFFLDQYTYNKGNAFLNPQYTHSFELSYTLKKSYTAAFNYSVTQHAITEVILADTVNKALYQTNENLATQKHYSLNINAPVKIAKWWNTNNNANIFYMGFRTPNLMGHPFKSGKLAFNFNTNHTLNITNTWSAEMTWRYQSPLQYGTYNILKAQYPVDLGISKSFADKKANIKLGVSDVFHTNRQSIESLIPELNYHLDQRYESQVVRLTLTYRFGKNDLTPSRKRSTGAEEENSRVKGGN